MRGALVMLIALSGPVMAQDGMPEFDGDLVDSCLSEQTRNLASCISKAANTCIESEGGYTTVGMSYCLSQELDHWDGLLNQAYGALMTKAKANDAEMASLGSAAPQQAPLLTQMQRDWIAYRDSTCAFEGSLWGGGTGAGPAGTGCMLEKTAAQYLWLNDHLTEGP
jgi:uncharacterized protein YecT (DUF1311 family)